MAGLYPTYISSVTVAATGNTDVAPSGLYPTTEVTFKAHPSNSGVMYVKNTTTTGAGYPLNPGETLVVQRPDLHDYVVSGVSGQRLVFAAYKS